MFFIYVFRFNFNFVFIFVFLGPTHLSKAHKCPNYSPSPIIVKCPTVQFHVQAQMSKPIDCPNPTLPWPNTLGLLHMPNSHARPNALVAQRPCSGPRPHARQACYQALLPRSSRAKPVRPNVPSPYVEPPLTVFGPCTAGLTTTLEWRASLEPLTTNLDQVLSN